MSNSSLGSRYSLTFKCAARCRRSAPFQYKFRSDDEVNHLWLGLRNRHSICTDGDGHDNCDSEESIVSLCSASSDGMTDTDSTTVLQAGLGGLPTSSPAPLSDDSNMFQDNDPERHNSLLIQKRQYTNVNPLCVVPSRKRAKLNQIPTTSEPLRKAAKTAKVKPVKPFKAVSFSSKDDAQLLNTVDKVKRDNLQSKICWQSIGRLLKRPVVTLQSRYIKLLALQNEQLEATNTRLLIQNKRQQPNYEKGVDLSHHRINTTGQHRNVSPSSTTSTDNRPRTINPTTNLTTVVDALGDNPPKDETTTATSNTSFVPESLACNNIANSSTLRDHTLPYTSEEDAIISDRLPATCIYDCNFYATLRRLADELRRTIYSVKLRWSELKEELVATASSHSVATATRTRLLEQKNRQQSNYEKDVNLSHHRINTTGQFYRPCPTSTTLSINIPAAINSVTTSTTVVDALAHNMHRRIYTTATLKPLVCTNIANHSTLRDHSLPFTSAEDAIISERLPTTCIYDRKFYTRLRRLADELRRTIYSVKLRWSELNKETLVAAASSNSVRSAKVQSAPAPSAIAVEEGASRLFTTTTRAVNSGFTMSGATRATTIDLPTTSAMATITTTSSVPGSSTMSTTIGDDAPYSSWKASTTSTVSIANEPLRNSVRASPVATETRFKPFTAAEDALILDRVPLSLHKTRDLYLGFAPLSQELNRSIDSLKYRWMFLYNTSRRANDNAAAIGAKDRRCVNPSISVAQSTHTAQPSATTTDTTVSASSVPASPTDIPWIVSTGYNAETMMLSEILPQEADITHTIDIVNPDPTHAVSTDSIMPSDTIQLVNMSNSAESSCNVYPSLASTEKSVFGTCALALSPLQVEGGVSMDRNRNSASQNCFVDTCTGSTDNDCYW